jgi:hypothetical protein
LTTKPLALPLARFDIYERATFLRLCENRYSRGSERQYASSLRVRVAAFLVLARKALDP